MAASTGQINVEALDTVLKSIGTTYNALKALDAQMDATLINKFAKLAQGVNQFTNSLEKIIKLPDLNLAASVKSLDDFFKAIQRIDEQVRATGLLDSSPIVKFSNALYRLTLSLAEIKFDPTRIKEISDGVVSLVGIATTAALPAGFEDYGKSLKGFAKSFGDVIASTSAIPLAGFNTKLKSLTTNLAAIANLPVSAPLPGNFDEYIKGLKAFTKIEDIFKSLNTIQIGKDDSFSKIVKFFTTITTLADSTKDVVFNPALAGIVKNVADLLTAFATTTSPNVGPNISLLQAGLSFARDFFIDLGRLVSDASIVTIAKAKIYLPVLVSVIAPIFDFFKVLTKSSVSVATIAAATNALSQALGEVQVLFGSLQAFVATTNPILLVTARLYLSGITPIFDAFASIFASVAKSAFTIDKLRALSDLFPAITQFFQVFGTLVQDITSITSIGQGVGKIVQAFLIVPQVFKPMLALFDIFQVLPDIHKDSIESLRGVFDAALQIMTYLGSTFTSLSERFDTIGSVGKLLLQRVFVIGPFFGTFFKFLREIGGLLRDLQGIDPGSVQGLAGIFQGFYGTLNAFSSFLSNLDTIFDGNFVSRIVKVIGRYITVRLYIGQIVNVIQGVTNVFKGMDAPSVEGIAGVLRGLGTTLSGLGDFINTISNSTFLKFDDLLLLRIVQRLIQFRVGLAPLGIVLRQLAPLFQLSGDVDVRKIAEFTKAISEVLNSITHLFEVFGQSDFSLSFTKIAKIYLGLNAALSPLKSLAKSLTGLPKSDGLGDAAKYLEAVAKFVTFAVDFSLSENKQIDPAFFKSLNELFKALNFKNLKDFQKNAGGIEALATFAGKLGSIFEALDKLPSDEALNRLKTVDFSGLENLGKPIGILINSLHGVTEGDIARIQAVAQLLDNVSKIDALKDVVGGSGEKAVESLSEVRDVSGDVTKGILKANIITSIFSTTLAGIGSVIATFNPVSLGRDFVEAFVRINGAVDTVRQTLAGVATQIQALGGSISGFGNNLLTNFGIGNIASSDIFKTTVEFDKLGSSLEVFGGLTKAQRKDAEDYANVLGKEYPLSANEALKATLDLVKAGQSAESAKSILGPAADLASLSDSGSIENATSFIIQATSAFRDFNEVTKASYENSAVAVNIISSAADSSTASVESLAEGLKAVGPVASGFGLSLEETTAALAIFTDGGLSGAAAGTQLKSILTNLTTATAKKELKKLGVQLSDTAGNIRPLNDILNDIQKKFTQTGTVVYTTTKKLAGPAADQLKTAEAALAAATRQQFLIGNDLNATGLGKNADKKLNEAKQIADNATAIITQLTGSATETEKITANIKRSELQNAESLKKIAGSYGQAGLAILLAQGQDGLKDFMEQMDAVAPASVRAQKALDNISGDMIQLQGSVETLTTKALLPLLEKFFRPFVQIGRFVVDTILTMNDSTLEFIATALTLGSALLTVVGAAAVLAGGLIELGGASAGLVTFLAFGAKSLTLGLVGGLAGLAAGIATLAAGFLILAPVLSIITAGFNALYEIFSKDLGGAATQAEHLGERISGALGQIGTAVGQVLDFISVLVSGGNLGSLDDLGKGIGGFFNSLSLAVTRFETSGAGKTLSDIGNIFAGITKALTFDSGAQKAADDAVGAIDNVNEGFTGKSAREAAKARKAFAKEYSGFILNLVKNNGVLKSVLGENLTSADVQKYLEKAVGYVQTIRTGIGSVFGSFGKAFESAQAVFKTGGLGAAIQTFVTDLGKNLDSSLGGLSANVLDAIGGLFNIDTVDLSKIFSAKGFAAGVAALIQKGLAELKKLLLSNRDGIKGFLTFVFENLFLGTLNIGKFVADALGQKGIGDFVQSIIDALKTVFGGLVDTVLNLIAGQDITTALKNAFGPGIQPFLDLVASLGKAVDNIVGFIGTLFNAIFKPPAGAAPSDKPFLLQLFDGIVEGITGVIDFLNTNVLDFLKTGDIGGLITNLVNSITTSIQSLDLPTKFVEAANSILNGLIDALKTAFLTVGDVLGFDAQGFLDGISAAMKKSVDALGKDATPFNIAVTAIQAALVTALNGVFTGIGDLLNIDPSGVLDKVDTALQGLVDSIKAIFADNKIFDSINLIITNLTFALSSLFNLFSGGDADNATAKVDPLRIALEGLFNFFGNLVATTLDTFKDYIKAIDQLFTVLAKLSPQEILGVTIALGGLGIAIVSYTGLGAVGVAMGVGLTAMSVGVTALLSPLITIAFPLLVFSQTLRALAQNVDSVTKAGGQLKQLDFAGLLGNFATVGLNIFTDLAFNIANLFGIDSLFGHSREDFQHYADVIEIYFNQAFYSIGRVIRDTVIQPISDFITVTIPLIVSELQKIRLQIDAARGDQAAQGELGVFNNIDAVAGGGLSFSKNTAQQFADFQTDVFKGGDAAKQRLIAIAARDNVAIYNKALADYTAAPDAAAKQAVIDNVTKFFDFAQIGDTAVTLAAQQGQTNFLQAYFDSAAKQGIDTTEIQKRLADDATQMFNLSLDGTSQQAAIDRLNMEIDAVFKATGVTPAVLVKARDDLQAKADSLIAVADGGDGKPPTAIPVTVTPDPTVVPPAPGTGLKTAKQLEAELRNSAGETPTGTPIEVPIGVNPRFQFMPSADGKTPQQKLQDAVGQLPTDGTGTAATFDSSTLNNPKAVDDFNTSVTTLATNITALGKELSGIPLVEALVTTTLTNIQTAVTTFRDVTVPLFGEVKLAVDPIAGSVQAINNALISLFFTATVGFPAMAASAFVSVSSISFSFFTLSTAANTSLQNVITKVKELANGFRDAATASGQIKLPAGTGGGDGRPPGRAGGGATKPYSTYEVHDTKSPEIYNDGKRSLLLTGNQPGYVTNLADMPSLGSNRSTGYPGRIPQASGPTFNANNITINEGTISITVQVQGGAAATPQKIAAEVKSQVSELQRRAPVQKMSDALRSFHK